MSPRARWITLAVVAGLVAGGAAVALIIDDGDADGRATASAKRWRALQPSPLERTEVGAARVGRFIYVVGGFAPPNGGTTNQVERYDTAAGTWSPIAPMPIGVNHPAVAAGAGDCRGRLYVYGGYTADGSLTAEVDALQRYEPETGTWSTLPGSGIPRGAASLAAAGCSLYAIGGASGGNTLRLVQAYDIRRGSWRSAPSLRVAREHLAAVAIGHRLLAFGGRDAGRNLDAVEELDTRRWKWRRRPPVPTPRSGFGAAVVGGWAVVVGGEQLSEGDATIRAVEAFDPRSRRWRKLPGMLTPRHGLGVASRGRMLFAAEGGPQPGLSYSTALEALRLPPDLLPSPRSGFRDGPPG